MQANFYQYDLNKFNFLGKKPNNKIMNKVVKSQKRHVYSQYNYEQIKNLVDDGLSINEISKEIGRKMSATRNILNYFGLKTKQSEQLSSINQEELIEMLNSGSTQKEIAGHFKIKNAGILSPLIKKLGKNAITQEQVNQISAEELQHFVSLGWSQRKIANHYKVAEIFIQKRMKDLDIKCFRKIRAEKTISIEILKHCIFDLNMKIAEISAKYDVTQAKIYTILRKNDIKTPSKLNRG